MEIEIQTFVLYSKFERFIAGFFFSCDYNRQRERKEQEKKTARLNDQIDRSFLRDLKRENNA